MLREIQSLLLVIFEFSLGRSINVGQQDGCVFASFHVDSPSQHIGGVKLVRLAVKGFVHLLVKSFLFLSFARLSIQCGNQVSQLLGVVGLSFVLLVRIFVIDAQQSRTRQYELVQGGELLILFHLFGYFNLDVADWK